MLYNADLINVIDASVAKLVDARDLKSLDLTVVPVRLRPEAPIKFNKLGFYFYITFLLVMFLGNFENKMLARWQSFC